MKRPHYPLRQFIETLEPIGFNRRRSRYSRRRDTEVEAPDTDRELVHKLMQIARGEVRRYLHSIITAAVPEWRHKSHSEATKAGLERSRLAGRCGGRRKSIDVDVDRVMAMRGAGASWRAIEEELHVPHSSIRKAVKQSEVR